MLPLLYHSTIPIRFLLCETNPIPGDAGRDGVASCDIAAMPRFGKQTQFGSELCQTKPPSPDATGPQGRGTMDQLRKTNPISSSLTEVPRLNCAKQSQIWVGWDIRGTTYPGADYAKQTQFATASHGTGATGAWDAGQSCKTNPISPPASLGPAGRSRETKPIAPGKVSGEDAPPAKSQGSIVRNKPNLTPNRAKRSQFRQVGRAGGAKDGNELCKTKPIARSEAPRRCPPSGRPRGKRISTESRRKCDKIGIWSLFGERVGDADEKAVPSPAWVVDGRLCGLPVAGATGIGRDDH